MKKISMVIGALTLLPIALSASTMENLKESIAKVQKNREIFLREDLVAGEGKGRVKIQDEEYNSINDIERQKKLVEQERKKKSLKKMVYDLII